MIYYQVIKDTVFIEGIDDILIPNDEELDVKSPYLLTLEDAEEYKQALIETTDFSDIGEWQYFEYQIIKITVPPRHKVSSEWVIKCRVIKGE